jgi:hypothetical protein
MMVKIYRVKFTWDTCSYLLSEDGTKQSLLEALLFYGRLCGPTAGYLLAHRRIPPRSSLILASTASADVILDRDNGQDEA